MATSVRRFAASLPLLAALMLWFVPMLAAQTAQPTLTQDKERYLPGESIYLTGKDWAPGATVSIYISDPLSGSGFTVQATADENGSFSASTTMPDTESANLTVKASDASAASVEDKIQVGRPENDADRILNLEQYWNHRVTYPTGKFNPGWLRKAAEQDAKVKRGIPKGKKRGKKFTNGDTGTATDANTQDTSGVQSFSLNANGMEVSPVPFIALGPQPERMTGCSGCFDYGTTSGRVNDIVIDPTTTANGSIVAYAGTVGGGVWKTVNCCSANTTWTVTTDDPLIGTTSIDTITIDPNNHNVIYAGTGDLNYGSFSMGSQGILKSTDGGATWSVKGANVFGASYSEPAGQFPQYDAVGKVRVDPNDSNKVIAGTKKGLFLSYDGGESWTGPCTTNSFAGQRQDITGLELTKVGDNTRIIAAVGVRGFATTVQYDLGNNGANGLYRGTMPASGCPSFTTISGNGNGFTFGAQVTGSPYATNVPLNAASGTPYGGLNVGNQLGRIDVGIAPSDPNVMYAQVQSIAANNNSGCGNANGCQLGAFASTDGGDTWSFMAGSQGGALRECGNTGTQSTTSSGAGVGDYPQNWYDQGVVVDPNNPDRVIFNTFDTWLVSRTGTQWYDISCGYAGNSVNNHVVHVDHHAQAFVAGNSDIFLNGGDGGVHGSTNLSAANINTARPSWFNMDGGFNTIEFYSGDISGNFFTSSAAFAAGGAQDNGPSTASFGGAPTGPVQWQMGTGGDGFYARIDPVGTGGSLRFWLGNNSGGLSRCIGVNSAGASRPCTEGGATWSSKRGAWTGDTQSFILPFDIFRGGIPGGDDCPAAASNGGCGHLIAATTRVWETINGNSANTNGAVTWLVTNNPTNANLTKGILGNRSFINQVKYAPKTQTVAIIGTNDGAVQFGFNMGTGVAAAAQWVNVTDGNAILPNRPVLGIAVDPTTTQAPIGYAAVGGFDENTPSTPGHIFRVVCEDHCTSFKWQNKSGNLPNIPVDSIIANPNFPMQVFAGTDFGLYYTDDITAVSPVWQRFANVPAVMIWDMQIDRGATALSLWTRGRGAYAWPLPIGPENPIPTDMAVASASGTNGGTAALSANLSSGGNPLQGKTVNFSLNGSPAGSAVTDADGNASTTASLAGIAPGTYPGGVSASFDGDNVYAASNGANTLYVKYSTGTCNGGPGLTVLSPINPDGSSNFKQGSNVTAKFRVCDASGASIGESGTVASFRLVSVNGADTDQAVASTTPFTEFRFDPTDQQWIFNISTKSLIAGNTYTFRITLNDGSSIDFRFTLK